MTRFAWNASRTNYFTQTFVKGCYVSACGTLYARRINGRYHVINRSDEHLGSVGRFADLGTLLETT